ncbi:EAL domain-containing protein [Affinibrenneria salicis]|uniref:cyclic-guanylate-specific phosphodiesterase n=1 Tax=Affinibrenneria salicis TaxID=2590031 RepID=A0A5J5G3Q4_9GAMM|nr:cyclic diguanylate phosphodiesterase [Affinibrenneria salicis]KAA9000663.1 EAL domain-containing protein [Affinibrenneria salicis]
MVKSTHVPAAKYRWLSLAAAGLLPFLLGMAFSFYDASQDVKRNLKMTNQVILHQAEIISRQAWDMVATLQPFEGQACSQQVSSDLLRLGTLAAYFRSLGLTKGPSMYCSSVSGDRLMPLSTIIQQQLPSPLPAQWNISLPLTHGVLERPAVLYASNNGATSYGAFAIVDAQYLLDFMSAMGNARPYFLTIQFGNGYQIQEGGRVEDDHPFIAPMHNKTVSNIYPIVVRATLPASAFLQEWRRAFITFLPLALILAIIFVSIVRSWQQRKMSLRDELRKGMLHNEFAAHYQPIYDIAARRCCGVEVLLRWYRPGGRSISPDVFIPSAEAEGLIIPLTHHLFGLMIEDIRHWRVPTGFHLDINIAAEHMQHPDFIQDIQRLSAALSPHQFKITLEITERSLIVNRDDVVRKLTELRRQGFIIAIDDFGTGHCSLSYLQTFPLDYLKIDKAFIGTIESAHHDTPVLDAIVGLSRRLALDMVAEGVNTRHEYRYLKQNGINYLQGYLYARPMNSKSLMTWLRRRERRPVCDAAGPAVLDR